MVNFPNVDSKKDSRLDETYDLFSLYSKEIFKILIYPKDVV